MDSSIPHRRNERGTAEPFVPRTSVDWDEVEMGGYSVFELQRQIELARDPAVQSARRLRSCRLELACVMGVALVGTVSWMMSEYLGHMFLVVLPGFVLVTWGLAYEMGYNDARAHRECRPFSQHPDLSAPPEILDQSLAALKEAQRHRQARS